MGVKTAEILVEQRVLARRRETPDRRWRQNTGPNVFPRADGAWTRNINGYDLAEIVCQQCVLGDHAHCVVAEHAHTGYSCCACNGRVEVIGAARAANGKENR